MGQNQWYDFGAAAPPFSGDWDVHGILAHGHIFGPRPSAAPVFHVGFHCKVFTVALPILAEYGIAVGVYQDGWLEWAGFESTGRGRNWGRGVAGCFDRNCHVDFNPGVVELVKTGSFSVLVILGWPAEHGPLSVLSQLQGA